MKDTSEPLADAPTSSDLVGATGAGGHELLFSDPRHVRGDARLLEQALTVGGRVSPEKADRLIERVVDIASVTESPRELAALMRCIHSYARLALDAVKVAEASAPRVHAHAHLYCHQGDQSPTMDTIRQKLGLSTTNGV